MECRRIALPTTNKYRHRDCGGVYVTNCGILDPTVFLKWFKLCGLEIWYMDWDHWIKYVSYELAVLLVI